MNKNDVELHPLYLEGVRGGLGTPQTDPRFGGGGSFFCWGKGGADKFTVFRRLTQSVSRMLIILEADARCLHLFTSITVTN